MRTKGLAFLVMIIVVPVVLVALAAVGGGVVMLLWNWLMPTIFGWRAVTFWQALGLLALCRILFGGVGRHHFPRRSWSPEARSRFRAAIHRRWGMGLGGSAPEEEGVR